MTPEQVHSAVPQVVERLRKALSPECIYLYGSVAKGIPGPCGDLNVLVVVPTAELDFLDRTAVAYRALARIGTPVDVQVYAHQEFESRAAFPVSFERTVRTKGRLVYAA